jgi:hypothetical protein
MNLISRKIKSEEINIFNKKGEKLNFAVRGEDIYFHLRFKISEEMKKMSVPLEITIRICDQNDTIITALSSFFTDESPKGIENISEVTCFVPKLPLLVGKYSLSLLCFISGKTGLSRKRSYSHS